ncbi:MAG: LicD family protein, partial [Candidatus Neomarinimicrobiota bacterium]
MLQFTTGILDRLRIPYGLDAGTLLGIIRENRLLPWDNDIDLYAFWEDRWKLRLAVWLFRLRGYHVSVRKQFYDLPPLR